MSDQTPEAVVERFSELLADGDLEAMMQLYEPDAAFAPNPASRRTDTSRSAPRSRASSPSSRAWRARS